MAHTHETVVTLTTSVYSYITAKATTTGKDPSDVLIALVEKAVADAQYRARRNAQAWAEKKALRENYAVIKALAEEAGLELPAEL